MLLCVSSKGFSALESEEAIQSSFEQYVSQNQGMDAALVIIDSGNIEYFLSGPLAVDGTLAVSQDVNLGLDLLSDGFVKLELLFQSVKGLVNLAAPISQYLPDISSVAEKTAQVSLADLANYSSDARGMETMSEDLYSFLKGLAAQVASSTPKRETKRGLWRAAPPAFANKGAAKPQPSPQKMGAHTQVLNHILTQNQGSSLQKINASALSGSLQEIAQFLSNNKGTIETVFSDILLAGKEGFSGLEAELGWILSNQNPCISYSGGSGSYRTYMGFNLANDRIVLIITKNSQTALNDFAFSFLIQ